MRHPRERTIEVLTFDKETVCYQVFQAGRAHNASPSTIRRSTFEAFFRDSIVASKAPSGTP